MFLKFDKAKRTPGSPWKFPKIKLCTQVIYLLSWIRKERLQVVLPYEIFQIQENVGMNFYLHGKIYLYLYVSAELSCSHIFSVLICTLSKGSLNSRPYLHCHTVFPTA